MTRFPRQLPPPVLPTLLLALIGVAAGIIALGYEVGSFTDMGPGFVPLMLGSILVLLCVLILWREKPFQDGSGEDTAEPFAWRPFGAVAAGMLAWVLLAESTGFFIASFCQIVLSALALPAPRWRGIMILAGFLAIAGYLLFVVQLGVPLEAVG